MDKPNINELEDIAPYVFDHLVPEINDSVEACMRSYHDDIYNDMWIFGTHLWKNTWNRFESVSQYEDCPFKTCGKGNEYKLKIGPFILRHHRIDHESKLPKGGKAVKASAAQQLYLFGNECKAPVEIDNIVLAIDANVQDGLKEVFIGELKPKQSNAKKYKWGKKVPVYLADGVEASSLDIIQIANIPGFEQIPEEKIAVVPVKLNKIKTDKKTKGSDSK